MLAERNGTLPANSTRTLQHHNKSPRQSPQHHNTLPPATRNYSPQHQHQPHHHHHHHHLQHQSPKHPVPTTSSGVPAQGPPPPGHHHHHHQPPMMRSFSSPQHQPAATVMPRSMHRDHYQPITQHDLEVSFWMEKGTTAFLN